MKIEFGKKQKEWATVAELPQIKKMINDFKGEKFQWEAEAAASLANGSSCEILELKAEIAGNRRIYNYYSDESGRLDIWLDIKAYDSWGGFYVIGAYLSDIWSLSDNNRDEIRGHMYIREFKEIK